MGVAIHLTNGNRADVPEGWPVIVLDPGHGGKDSGALSPQGFAEKDWVLEISLRIRELLVPYQVAIAMTRMKDVFVERPARAQLANDLDADLFISVHLNSAKVPASGYEVWTSPRVTSSDRAGGFYLQNMATAFPGEKNRGPKEAKLDVLVLTKKAAILTEGSFMHTEEGEAFCVDPQNREKMAMAIARTAVQFLKLRMPEGAEPEEPSVPEPGPHEGLPEKQLEELLLVVRGLEDWAERAKGRLQRHDQLLTLARDLRNEEASAVVMAGKLAREARGLVGVLVEETMR